MLTNISEIKYAIIMDKIITENGYQSVHRFYMRKLRLSFSIPEDIAELLRSRVDKRKRSTFVSAAVRDKLQELEHEQLKQSLREGYQARRDEDARINSEWEELTLESWRCCYI